ncbi:MAG: RluA family pseudouridine synthase [Desulfuromonadaceae bacterium]|nr:RluA family pseudouridine synthase [Desulfuromonadaceae bacterium]
MTKLTVNDSSSGQSVLAFLQQQIPAAPTGYLQQLARKGRLLVNQQVTTGQALLQSGDVLSLPDSKRLMQLLQESQRENIEVLLEGPDFLAVYKPAGLAVHRGVGHETDNLADRVGLWLKRRRHPFSAFPVHRLDVGTSGPVLFAKGRRAASILGGYFMAGQVEKHYIALVAGQVDDDGELHTPVPAKGKLRSAVTRYRRVAGNRHYSLLQLELVSGRKHQIRRQLADAGHPLIGDRRYGGPSIRNHQQPFLHCSTLAWPNSTDGQRLTVSCPLPQDLQHLLLAAGLCLPDNLLATG